MEIRAATVEDAAAIATIYNRYVVESTVTFDLVPRTTAEQRQRINDRSGAYAVIVAVQDDEIAGFASLSPYRDRPGYATTVEDSVYIHPDHQRQGVGRVLLGELVEVARAHGFHSMMARIVGGHQASIGLHAAHGFGSVGIEREVGRKFGKWLDVMVMQLML